MASLVIMPGPKDRGIMEGNGNSSERIQFDNRSLPPEQQALYGGRVIREQQDTARLSRVWRFYLLGQLSNVAKAAVWWSTFGVLTSSLLESNYAVGITRATFNAALVLISPLASVTSERVNIRGLLITTTITRVIVWVFFVPAAWLLFSIYLERRDLCMAAALFLMFVDGAHVAFANVVDIDCGGIDSISCQYRFPVPDGLREYFNTLHQTVFDASFIAFTPPLAVAIWQCSHMIPLPAPLRQLLQRPTQQSAFALLLGMGFIFSVLSVLSLACYASGLPSASQAAAARSRSRNVWESGEWESAGTSACESLDSDDSFTDVSEDDLPSVMREMKLRLRDINEGFWIVIREKALAWRVLFLALETALEDSIVSIVIPMIALKSPSLFGYSADATLANVWVTGIISAGKAGGCLAGLIMNHRWIDPPAPSRDGAYRSLFWWVLASAATVVLLPAAYLARDMGFPTWLCISMIFISSFLYFCCSAAPKVGFASFLQSLVASHDVACKVFGFVGAFVTIVDALVILAVNFLFAWLLRFGPLYAVSAVAALYLFHGLIESIIGPFLILQPSNQSETASDNGRPSHTNTHALRRGSEDACADFLQAKGTHTGVIQANLSTAATSS